MQPRHLILALCAVSFGALAAVSSEGLHTDWLDKSVDPATDFFSYANGGWKANNPIPPAYSRWGTFNVLIKQNDQTVNDILEKEAKGKHKPGSIEQKVGDFYATGMDEAGVEKTGIAPLKPVFDAIDAIHDQASLQKEVADLQMIGVNAMFGFGQQQDFKDSTKVIGVAFQGGLGLPDRDYYIKTADKCTTPTAPAAATGKAAASGTPASAASTASAAAAAKAANDACLAQAAQFQKFRDAYVAHISKMLQLLGDPADKADAEAKAVMGIETGLAESALSRIERRDPPNIYHPMDLTQLGQATPDFAWKDFFADVGHPELTGINLGTPGFFAKLDSDLKSVSLDDWKAYLRWQTVDAFAPYLPKAFVDEDFAMNSSLTGAKELLPRWQRVVSTEDGAMGFATGELYVKEKFPPSSKLQVVGILHGIRAALKDDLSTLSWMSPETRKAAIHKLDLMQERIGYPDKWRDYSKLVIKRDSYVQNVIRANEFEQKRQLAKIGKPVDMNEWGMIPQEVNAYYSPQRNNINFPAGILQPPFFDPKAPPAVNYGSLGFVMGHEMTHGFDDQGARFDPQGNFMSGSGWWTAEDFKKFREATDCISDHFSTYTVANDTHVQGHLITGEATADLGGLTLAWRAFHASKYYKEAKTIDGFTPDQQFFLGAGHVWAENVRPEEQIRRATIDPHPPGKYRVNGTLANMPQFQETYHVPDGSPMVNKDRCVIW